MFLQVRIRIISILRDFIRTFLLLIIRYLAFWWKIIAKKEWKKFAECLQIWKIVVPLQTKSREKATKQKLNGALVQLVRIHACHAWGHGFESRTHRNKGCKSSYYEIYTLFHTLFVSICNSFRRVFVSFGMKYKPNSCSYRLFFLSLWIRI